MKPNIRQREGKLAKGKIKRNEGWTSISQMVSWMSLKFKDETNVDGMNEFNSRTSNSLNSGYGRDPICSRSR